METAGSISKLTALVLLLVSIGVLWLFSRNDIDEHCRYGAHPGFVIFVFLMLAFVSLIRLLFIWL